MSEKKDLAVGGQAVIEGVMMRSDDKMSCAVRNPEKEIIIETKPFTPFTKKYKFFNVPIIRGFINLIEMMYVGTKTLMYSAEIAIEEETQKASTYEFVTSLIFSLSLSIGLFIILPAFLFTHLKGYIDQTIILNLIEGLFRFSIFLAFICFTLFFEDMRRVYQYHGAEHKSIHAYEADDDLTVTNVKKYTTLHPRCGTSFILVVMIISIVIFTLLGRPDFLHRVLYKIILMPMISGIAYEVIKLQKKVDLKIFKLLILPGLMLQKLTTREPDEEQIEVALAALKEVI